MVQAIKQFFLDVIRTMLALLRSVVVFLLSIFLLILLVSILSGSFKQDTGDITSLTRETVIRDENGADKIVLAKLSGIILSESSTDLLSTSNGGITPQKVQSILNQARKDSLVKAIIFDIDSPGGSPVASDRIYEMITNFRNETKIPVIFLMGDMAASGGYYIASAADHIIANPATITGSIGVILESYNLEELYKKIGVSKVTFKQGQYKDILSESRPLTEEEQKIIDSLNENTYNLFVSRVAQGRKLSEEQVRNLATGQIYSGRQAKDLQLVDSLGNLDEAIYQAKSRANIDRFKVVEYESSSLFQDVFGSTLKELSPSLGIGNIATTLFPPLLQR